MSDSEESSKNRLPVAPVKRISHMVPGVKMMTAEFIELLSLATDQFIHLLAEEAAARAASNGRKTVQQKDIDACISSDRRFKFLDGALDGWPEPSARSERSHQKKNDDEKDLEDTVQAEESDGTEDAGIQTEDVITSLQEIVPEFEMESDELIEEPPLQSTVNADVACESSEGEESDMEQDIPEDNMNCDD